MAIFLSSVSFDPSTDAVMDWLHYTGNKVVRFNGDDVLVDTKIEINTEGIDFNLGFENGNVISWQEVSCYWHRRGKLNFKNTDHNLASDEIKGENIHDCIKDELTKVAAYLLYMFEQKPGVGGYFTKSPNKLMMLQRARKAKLDIPRTTIVCTKKELAAINYPVITKPIFESITFQIDGEGYSTFTEVINPEFINNLPDEFLPILVQEKLDKAYELRIFYFRGRTYAIALFSQLDNKTSLDFRNYNYAKMNRQVPFALSDELQQKIAVFMKLAELETGSIDIVVTMDNRFVFLEVNPVGQFGFVSEAGNYYIEKDIAEILINLKNGNELHTDNAPGKDVRKRKSRTDTGIHKISQKDAIPG